MKIGEIEAPLTAAGVAFKRDFEWHEGWRFEVEGVTIAEGAAAIGTLEDRLAEWWAKLLGNLDFAGDGCLVDGSTIRS